MIVDVNILIEATAFKLCDVSADSSSIFFHIKNSNIMPFQENDELWVPCLIEDW